RPAPLRLPGGRPARWPLLAARRGTNGVRVRPGARLLPARLRRVGTGRSRLAGTRRGHAPDLRTTAGPHRSPPLQRLRSQGDPTGVREDHPRTDGLGQGAARGAPPVIRPVIIGGGFAGLSAAVQLAAQGLQPLVLEARPHLGGRAYSFTDGATGEQVDNGQHAMMGCYTHALAFLERIGATRKLVRQSNLRVAMAERGGGAGVIACPALP